MAGPYATFIARHRLSPTSSSAFDSTISSPSSGLVDFVVIQAIGGDIHLQDDGTDATTAAGFLLPENSKVEVHGSDSIANFRCIDDGDAAELECVAMGRPT